MFVPYSSFILHTHTSSVHSCRLLLWLVDFMWFFFCASCWTISPLSGTWWHAPQTRHSGSGLAKFWLKVSLFGFSGLNRGCCGSKKRHCLSLISLHHIMPHSWLLTPDPWPLILNWPQPMSHLKTGAYTLKVNIKVRRKGEDRSSLCWFKLTPVLTMPHLQEHTHEQKCVCAGRKVAGKEVKNKLDSKKLWKEKQHEKCEAEWSQQIDFFYILCCCQKVEKKNFGLKNVVKNGFRCFFFLSERSNK